MSTSIQHLLCGALLTLASANASATSPCRDPDGCLDEWAVMILLLSETQLTYCPQFASWSETQKKELLEKVVGGEGSPGYLERLRATEEYAKRPDIAAQIKEKPEAIEGMCKDLLIKPK
ncbi:hypothetical protein [Massilia aquatica]|uniref:Uncharacterized protein n=1 Tax=Massilia aquatica TaxID=2609000 RepID=A0ABX0MJP1_9BURK|nr:hypothetical protein [Massilia aquatica]NHZ44507.1 hypothetical protein [Massilia aquatica]